MSISTKEAKLFQEGRGVIHVETVQDVIEAIKLLDPDMSAGAEVNNAVERHYNAGRPDHCFEISEAWGDE